MFFNRLFNRKADDDKMSAKAEPIPVISMKVYRAATDTWEDGPPVTATIQKA